MRCNPPNPKGSYPDEATPISPASAPGLKREKKHESGAFKEHGERGNWRAFLGEGEGEASYQIVWVSHRNVGRACLPRYLVPSENHLLEPTKLHVEDGLVPYS